MRFVQDIKKYICVFGKAKVVRAEEYEDDDFTYEYVELDNGQKTVYRYYKEKYDNTRKN